MLSLTWLGVEEKKFYILSRKKYDFRKKVVNLLPIADGEDRHYMAIKSLSRLLRGSSTKRNGKLHFHMNCLKGFPTEISRDKHFEYRKDNETIRIEMHEEGSLVKFHDSQYQFKVPYIMYADFEAILEPVEGSTPNPESSYTKVINQHIPFGFCVYSKFAYRKVENPMKFYGGEDCVKLFDDYISNEAHRLYHMFPEKAMKRLTCEQWRGHNSATICHISIKEFKWYDMKVRDYCHVNIPSIDRQFADNSPKKYFLRN